MIVATLLGMVNPKLSVAFCATVAVGIGLQIKKAMKRV
jgi:hypothetical protein